MPPRLRLVRWLVLDVAGQRPLIAHPTGLVTEDDATSIQQIFNELAEDDDRTEQT